MCSVSAEPASLGAACSASLTELGVESKASSSSSSSGAAAVMAAVPAALPDTCSRACGDDYDDYASTAASSQPPFETVEERFADIADLEEPEESPGASSSQQPPAAVLPTASPLAARARWADLAESDEEFLPLQTSLPVAAGDSNCSQNDASAPQNYADVVASSARAAPVQGAKQDKPAGVKTKGGKRGSWDDFSAADAFEVAWPMRQAGKSKANQWSSSSSESWWGQHEWGSKASNWWDSQPADWWGSTNQAKGDRWSKQPWAHGNYGAAKSQQVDRSSSAAAKPQCQFFVGIEEEPKFKVTRKILGPHGQHMKAIAEASGAKLRLRGRGSGFLEGPEQLESSDELMLCVSALDWAGYTEAVRLVTELMEDVYEQYRSHCRRTHSEAPALEVCIHEGPRAGSR